MVHYQVVRTTSRSGRQGLLHASQGRFRRDCPIMVCPALVGALASLLTPPSALFLIYSILSVISLIPTREQRQARHSRLSASDIESTTSASRSPPHQPWEMSEVPPTPGTTGGLKSPTTPRTMAFNTLSGKGKARASPITQARKQMGQVQGTGGAQVLPLRHHISMGDEVYKGPSER